MLAIGYILLLCLLVSLAYTFYGFAVGHKVHMKFGVIASFTFAGLLAMWPPREKLKLGIDLSGGTILVYEAVKENLSSNFNMGELISALKHPTRSNIAYFVNGLRARASAYGHYLVYLIRAPKPRGRSALRTGAAGRAPSRSVTGARSAVAKPSTLTRVMRRPSVRSMLRRSPSSAGETKVQASPVACARAVRPMRWT